MGINLSERAIAAPELLETMTGSSVFLGELIANPTIIIFDNQGGASVEISINDPSVVWKTFPAGEALVLDLRAAHGIASNYTFPIGTAFYGNGASGDFSISYLYAKNV